MLPLTGETRSPPILSRLFTSLGLGASCPPPTGPYLVKSVHARVSGSVLVQAFAPVCERDVGRPAGGEVANKKIAISGANRTSGNECAGGREEKGKLWSEVGKPVVGDEGENKKFVISDANRTSENEEEEDKGKRGGVLSTGERAAQGRGRNEKIVISSANPTSGNERGVEGEDEAECVVNGKNEKAGLKGFDCEDGLAEVRDPTESEETRRHYRRGVIKGTSLFASMPKFVLTLFLGAAHHPLNGTPRSARVWKENERSLPCVFFSHGLGGNSDVYVKTAADLASYGFVVICLEHEDGSASYAKTEQGQVVEYKKPPFLDYTRDNVVNFRAPFLQRREREIRDVVAYFSNSAEEFDEEHHVELQYIRKSVDPTKFFLGGHSFGGASSVFIAQNWPNRFKGVLLYDVWPFPIPDLLKPFGGGTPILSILSEPFSNSPEALLTKEMFQNRPNLISTWMPGTVHQTFSDTPFWGPSFLGRLLQLRGRADPLAAQESFIKMSVSFMAAVLGGSPIDENYMNNVVLKDDMMRRFPKKEEGEQEGGGVVTAT